MTCKFVNDRLVLLNDNKKIGRDLIFLRKGLFLFGLICCFYAHPTPVYGDSLVQTPSLSMSSLVEKIYQKPPEEVKKDLLKDFQQIFRFLFKCRGGDRPKNAIPVPKIQKLVL